MTALPITGFVYGEMKYQSQFAAIEISRMICKGQKKIEPNELMDSCSNLKTSGVTASGSYVLNDKSVAFCDMTKRVSDPEIQHILFKIPDDGPSNDKPR